MIFVGTHTNRKKIQIVVPWLRFRSFPSLQYPERRTEAIGFAGVDPVRFPPPVAAPAAERGGNRADRRRM